MAQKYPMFRFSHQKPVLISETRDGRNIFEELDVLRTMKL